MTGTPAAAPPAQRAERRQRGEEAKLARRVVDAGLCVATKRLTARILCSYKRDMALTYDPTKRDWTLWVRGLDFTDAEEVFAGVTVDFEDNRADYGEQRCVCVGLLRDRMVVIVWTPRGYYRHIISMRKANEREQARCRERLG